MSEQNHPKPYKLRINFFRASGKWAYEATATTNHFSFEYGFTQDIVNTQDGIRDGWQGEFHVTVENANPDYDCKTEPFARRLYKSGDFIGINKTI